MEKKMGKSERTRARIIETSAAIFNIKGYAGTSMSDLTEATGLTKGSIYGNFANKEEVALAVFDFNHRKVMQLVQSRVEQAANYYDKLLAYIHAYDHFTRNGFPEGGCPILNTAIEADDTNSLLKERAAKAINKWKLHVQDLYLGGIEKGEFKKTFDPSQFSLSLIAIIEGGVMIAKVTNSQSNLDKIMKTARYLLDQVKV
ncbi:TetR/AcrR family transcriptional regulator [Pedobacter sp. MC2016-15]|uniref:TetR/AcrR family transcriptional regulator n=1 Tax=Pedobacter sp. MC2016-15 TaxID=2994473 RepID=UPI0022460EB6|nr:TetR/AcrR family transcriptional regulator [Pedobacter sp. MC2016-15]MCX2477969.1 TetR/AcrR family transcriptional regulator [Pedobacter sp. MC2016-15]